jgi:hypothetical protein
MIRPGVNGLVAVVTTIQEPTPSMVELARRLHDVPLIAVGDKKGPRAFELAGARLVSLDEQRQLGFATARLLPEGHYARKNLGYLLAMQAGAGHIYETDDDNAPLPEWRDRDAVVDCVTASCGRSWLNVYRAYSRRLVWPRGLPLDEVRVASALTLAVPAAQRAPIQQGLANGSPDVDAVWRLILDENIVFDAGPSLALPRGVWCPFNSQSTWWWPEAFPLMYLPSHCSFRMTDIWRSFVAQRCLWELGFALVFHSAEVVQERNLHRLMRDFADEISGYLNNREIAEALEKLELQPGADALSANIERCYQLLVERSWVGKDELPLVRAWLEDCRKAT